MRSLSRSLVVLSIVVPAFLTAPAARAWGCKGHQTVALIAEKHLTADAKKLAADQLAVDPDRHLSPLFACGSQGLDTFAAASTWADAVRDPNIDAGFHFIDIPRDFPASSMSAVCAGSTTSCVTDAIRHQKELLEDSSTDPKVRAAAMRYLIHLVGDLHQPLHCTTNGDKGANCVPVTYFHTQPHHLKATAHEPHPDPDTYNLELHGIWDKNIIERDMKAAGATTVQAYANSLDTAFQDDFTVWEEEGIQIDDWAWDSHEHAEDVAYGDLPKVIAIDAHPDANVTKCSQNNRVGNRMALKHLVLSQTYQDDTSPAIQERLAMAGIRLAMILNDAAAHVH